MNKENYKASIKAALEAADLELEGLLMQHAELEKQIAQLRQTVGGLTQIWKELSPAYSNVNSRLPVDEWGLTELVLEALKACNGPALPSEIRDALVRLNFNLSAYKNPLAAIHTTLDRLTQQGKVEETVTDGKSAFRYLSILERTQRGLIKESRKQKRKK